MKFLEDIIRSCETWIPDISSGFTKDSFIFSFNKENIDNYTLSRVINEYYAIDNNAYFGPSFGDGDLNLCNYYDKPIRNTAKDFSV
jgi:hypothetical protein